MEDHVTTMRNWASVLAVAVVICLLQPENTPADNQPLSGLNGTAQSAKTVVLAPPEIRVYEISAGGVPELMDEWSAKETENVTRSLFSHFSSTKRKISMLKPDSDTDRELKEVRALLNVISQSKALETNSASVGSLESILQDSGGDALLIVQGVDQFATAGKKALNVFGTITGIAASALTGVAIIPNMEGTLLRMSLADRNGTIIWHYLQRGGADLRDQANCNEVVNLMLENFPRLDK